MVVTQRTVLVDSHQGDGCRPCFMAVKARHHQLAVHHKILQLYGVFRCQSTDLIDDSFLPDDDASAVFCQCHTRLEGCGLARTIDGFGTIPLRTRMLLRVIDAIDTAGTLHRLVQVQRVLQVFLRYLVSSLLQHHQVCTRDRRCVVVGAAALTPVRQVDGFTRRCHLNAIVVGVFIVSLIDDAVATGNELHRLADVHSIGNERTGQVHVCRSEEPSGGTLIRVIAITQIGGELLVERVLEILRFDEVKYRCLITPRPIFGPAPSEALQLNISTNTGKPTPSTAREGVPEVHAAAGSILEINACTKTDSSLAAGSTEEIKFSLELGINKCLAKEFKGVNVVFPEPDIILRIVEREDA